MEPADETAAAVARRAAAYCRMNFPPRWKAGAPRQDATTGRWVIPVVLPRGTGEAVELGQLAFDGETMRLTTPRQAMVERSRAGDGAE